MISLSGRRAVVTGGTRGIGAAVAKELVRIGAEVLAIAVSTDSTVPDGIQLKRVDLSDLEEVESLAKYLRESQVDVLINNAGINVVSDFVHIETSDFNRIQRINLQAPMLLMQAVIPGMRKSGWGRIVNITSIFGHLSRAGRAAYSASKFGLDGMTSAVAAEVACEGILANCVAPGFVDTDLTRRVLGPKKIEEVTAGIPIGRLAKPDEIARFVAWLASDENSYISGQNLLIDGGFTRV